MKNWIFSLAALCMMAVAACSFTSCSEEEEAFCYFTCGIGKYNVSSSGEVDPALNAYISAVGSAYYQALGMTMTEKENSIIYHDENYTAHKADLKAKFEAVNLPDAPETTIQYSVTFVLYGSNGATDLENMEVIASKTLTNH